MFCSIYFGPPVWNSFSPSESEEPELPEPQDGESQLVPPGTVILELPDDPPGPELAPGLAEGTLLPPGDGMLEFPADIPLLPPGPAVLPELPPGPEVLPGFTVVIPFPPGAEFVPGALPPGAPVPVFPADIPPGEEVPLVTWFPVIPEFPEFPDGGEYTLPAEPPSMAEASLRHTPELSKV